MADVEEEADAEDGTDVEDAKTQTEVSSDRRIHSIGKQTEKTKRNYPCSKKRARIVNNSKYNSVETTQIKPYSSWSRSLI